MAAGRKDVAVTGFDLGKKTLLGLEDKNYSIAVAVQNQYKMGYEAVMAAAAAAKDGSKPAQKLVNTGIRMADKNNYKNRYKKLKSLLLLTGNPPGAEGFCSICLNI